ncbi:hypothetical protein c7_L333 [Megavirus courdo7]|uniref:Uncharacterized protein n=1 Tax=Megavirus courdo7 TaxID=1128135 RepID=H2EAH6_9VIRU|nr:hypothetical protein c7_L333 [Megavirus courdo7]
MSQLSDIIVFQKEINVLINVCINQTTNNVTNKNTRLLNQVICYFNRLNTIYENIQNNSSPNDSNSDSDVISDSDIISNNNVNIENISNFEQYKINRQLFGFNDFDEHEIEENECVILLHFYSNNLFLFGQKIFIFIILSMLDIYKIYQVINS